MEQLDDVLRSELISSLFGQQTAPSILSNHAEPKMISGCSHPVFRGDTCTRCGSRGGDGAIATAIPLWYVYPDLSISHEEINRLRDTNLRSLLARKKLHLVLDLDHTLVHTRVAFKLTSEDKRFLAKKRFGIDHNVPEGGGELFKMANGGWTKLRPYVREFLREASEMFDMTVYTLGCRTCAWAAAKVLDPEGKCFGMWRVITREDCACLDKHKKVLDVVLAHERVVVVVDDNEGVWGDHKSNVIRIKPYNFFSYNSPDEDKDHDASPPKKSWSQLGGDESEERGELAKILSTLRAVHSAFFDGDKVQGLEEYERRDVREVLQRVLKTQKNPKKHKGNNKGKKKG